MGLDYKYVIWNNYKKSYDKIIALGMVLYLVLFVVITLVFNSKTTPETLVIRSFGSLAIVMLHIILIIGPLSRLNNRFLPILYNRRHLGVSMFIAALVHGGFSIFQFHALGNVNAFYSFQYGLWIVSEFSVSSSWILCIADSIRNGFNQS